MLVTIGYRAVVWRVTIVKINESVCCGRMHGWMTYFEQVEIKQIEIRVAVGSDKFELNIAIGAASPKQIRLVADFRHRYFRGDKGDRRYKGSSEERRKMNTGGESNYWHTSTYYISSTCDNQRYPRARHPEEGNHIQQKETKEQPKTMCREKGKRRKQPKTIHVERKDWNWG